MFKSSVYTALVILNFLLLGYIIYFLVSGLAIFHFDYKSVWLNASERYLTIRKDFLAAVVFTVIIPIILSVIKKRPLWLVQVLIIITVIFFWKTDFLQTTLFINQPTSAAHNMRLTEDFIDIKGDMLQKMADDLNILAADEPALPDTFLIDNTFGMRIHNDSIHLPAQDLIKDGKKRLLLTKCFGTHHYPGGYFKIMYIQFERGKVHSISFHPVFKKRKNNRQGIEIFFYPNGYPNKPFDVIAMGEIYPLNTNPMFWCSQYYSYRKKWIIRYTWVDCYG